MKGIRFRNLHLLLGVAIFLYAAGAAARLDPTKDKILYATGYSHLDDQWQWTIQDSINTFIPSSIHVNFAYFTNANFTNFTFSYEGALRYQLIKEYYPSDFLAMSNYIRQGRWHAAGAMITPSDVNIPAPESLIRHTLLANNYWSQTFGVAPVDYLLPDAFGFGYACPSIAAHCGLKGFSSWRIGVNSAYPIPFPNIGRWIGPDGQSVIAVTKPGAYSTPVTDNLANDNYHYSHTTNMFAASGLYLDYMYFGNSGDQGGGPSVASVSNVCLSVQTTNGLINVLCAGSDQMYRDFTPAQVAMLPPYQGEFIATTTGTGSYTSHGELKRLNRQCEQQAVATEAACIIADWLQGGGTYPQERLNKAWTRFLWHQMYDDITGVSIAPAYTFTWNDYFLTLNDFAAEQASRIGVVARALHTTTLGVPLVVYNPLSIAREDIVQAFVTFSNAPAAIRVYDGYGQEVPSQMGVPNGNRVPVLFLADVPSLGAAIYDVRPAATASTLNTGLTVSSSQVENSRYLVQLNSNGDVVSITDKLNNRQLLSGPIRWDFLFDQSTSLPAWELQYNNVVAAPSSYLSGPASIQILENGPARVSLAVTRVNAGSTFIERVRLSAGGAGDRVEWDITANWNSPQTTLKMEFPLAVTNALATYDLGLGTVRRPNDAPALYESPAQQWADLTASNSTYGVTIMNDCKYGWDKPDNHTLRQTIFHTPLTGGGFSDQASVDIGTTHRITMAIMGHTNDWRTGGSTWTAARLNQPLIAFQTLPHPPLSGAFSNSVSFLSCNNSNVAVRALKKAENTGETIVRLQELSGQPQVAQLTCLAQITAARLVNGAESLLSTLTPSNGTVSVSIGSYAPMTLALTLTPSSATVPNALSTPISLSYNLDAISTDGNRTNGNFDSGYTYPAELMPSSLVRGGVTFQLGPTNDNQLNALACQGQTISFNSTGYNRLYFLAAAASNDTTAAFSIAGQSTNLTIGYFTGFFGQWSPPSWRPNQEVAWICTHRHDGAGNNNAYEFCYLYKYRIDLPPGASSMVLPNSPNIRIFAMSLAINTMSETTLAGSVTSQNFQPWANAGPNQRVNAVSTNATASVTLNGSASADPGGQIVSYLWTQNGTPLATGAVAVVNLPIGTNSILLNVTDNLGATGVGAVTIIVQPPLIVSISANPASGSAPPLTVQFSGQAAGATNVATFDTTDDHLGTITAQGENNNMNGNNEVATNAFDDNISTKWLDFATNNPATRASWIQYQYRSGSRHRVTTYTLTSANDAPERDPSNWALLGSNDGGSSWLLLDSRSSQVFSNRFQTLSFPVLNPGDYNLYRLRIDKVANPTIAVAVQLAEIQLLGPPLYTYYWSFGDGTTVVGQKDAGPDIQQHTYTNYGTYTVVLGVTLGTYTGTNSTTVTVGIPLAAAASAYPLSGSAPLMVQFSGQISGGRTNTAPLDTTDIHTGTVTAQGENSSLNGNHEVAVNAFDDTAGTKWLDFAGNYPSTRQSWIQYQYPNGQVCNVTQYAVTSANDATTYPARNPANWRLLGSNNGGTSWDTLDTRINQVFATNFQRLAFSVPNTNAYNIYRFQIDSVANPSQAVAVQLDELELIASPPMYLWSFGDGTTSALRNPQHTYLANGVYSASLKVWDGLSYATTNMTIHVGQPSLTISTLSSNSLFISWPAWASGYNLFYSTNLTAPTTWALVTNAVTSAGTNLSVMIPLSNSGPAQFFQLK